MTCTLAMIGAVCVLSAPVGAEPQPFHYGKATNRASYAVASFQPELPSIGPVIAFRTARPRERKGIGLEELAYAGSKRASAKPFEAIMGKGRGKGFRIAHRAVDTSCFPKRLTGILRDAERHFRGRVIVTSGYRSKAYNRRVGGATRSQHLNCRAADVRIPGVSKTALFRYLRRHPKAGGVGIYRSQYVHIDIGRKRTWDWR